MKQSFKGVCIDCKNTKADASSASTNSPTKTDSKKKVSADVGPTKLDEQQATKKKKKKKKTTVPLTTSAKKSTPAMGKYKRGDGCSCKNSK